MAFEPVTFNVYEAGELCVVGFDRWAALNRLDVGRCREELAELIRQSGCRHLAFDLTGIKLLPSGMLGLMASLRKLHAQVLLFNASEDIREVLEITGLDQFMTLHTVELTPSGGDEGERGASAP